MIPSLAQNSLASTTCILRKSLPRVAASISSTVPSPTSPSENHINSNASVRSYTSRAHPQPKPQHSIIDGIRLILEQTKDRYEKRSHRWDLNHDKRNKALLKKGLESSEKTEFRNQDETISLSINLNLDPRKPNQALRGQMPLPHGTGKSVRLAVFSFSPVVIETAREEGAVVTGGEDLMEQILSGEVSPDEFDKVMATPDVIPQLKQKCGRLLGPKGLLPHPKMGNIVNENEIGPKIKEQLAGMVAYRTDKAGIVHAPVGKYSFGQEKLEQNIRTFLEGVVDAEPELDKKAKKQRIGGKGGKYVLKVHLNATQGKAVSVDLKTVDPNSLLFMTDGTI